MNTNIPKSSFIQKLLESTDKYLGIILITSVFCFIFALAHRAIFDPDIWLHLKAGEIIVQNKAVLLHDPFLFTFPAKIWVDHSWLFQVVCYFVYAKLGAEGIILLESYIIVLTFVVLFLIGRKRIKSYLEVSIFVFMAAYATLPRFNIRPDIFSSLFFVSCIYLLFFGLDKRIIWLLIPIQILWVNIHGYFFLGPLLVGLFLLGEFLRRTIWRGGDQNPPLTKKNFKRLALIFLLLVLLSFVNPQGLKGAIYPLSVFKETLTGENRIFFKNIQELKPTFQINSLSWNFYYLFVFLCFGSIALNFRKIRPIEIMLAVFFFLFALTKRNITFFVFIAYTILVFHLPLLLNTVSKNVNLGIASKRALSLILRVGLTVFVIFWLFLKINRVIRYDYYDFDKQKYVSLVSGIEERRYPKKAVDFLLENNINGPLLNDFNSGAYIIGNAYPKLQVFIDGRTELYGSDFFREYKAIIDGDEAAFDEAVKKYNIQGVLISTLSDDPPPRIIRKLYDNPLWHLVFLDESAVVFLKDSPDNKEAVSRHKINLKEYKAPQAYLRVIGIRRVYPQPYIKRAALFSLLGKQELVFQEANEALRITPNTSEAYKILGNTYLKSDSWEEAFKKLRAAVILNPRDKLALLDLSRALIGLKEYPAATRILKGILRAKSNYAPAYYELSRIYSLKGENKEAIKAIRKAVLYSSKNAKYHLKLGEELYRQYKINNDVSLAREAKERLLKAEAFAKGDEEVAAGIKELLAEIEKDIPG